MKKLFLIAIALFIAACGTKRQYFEPENVDASLDSSASLKAKIIDWNLISAKLSNNDILVKDYADSLDFKLEKNYNLIAYADGEFIVADNDGNLKIYDSTKQEIYAHKFEASVLSVAVEGDDLALVLANNSLVLANRSLGVKFTHTLSATSANDKRTAAPIFVDDIIIYPSLDGKLNVVSKSDFRILRDIIVSAEEFFNNVIFLKMAQDKIIAATATKVLAIAPNRTLSLDGEFKDVVLGNNELFVLEKDGNVIKTDLNLRKINEKKFEFAIFTKASFYNDKLYIAEKTGYLLKLDSELENSQVFKIDGLQEQNSFMDNDRFFYANKILYLL